MFRLGSPPTSETSLKCRGCFSLISKSLSITAKSQVPSPKSQVPSLASFLPLHIIFLFQQLQIIPIRPPPSATSDSHSPAPSHHRTAHLYIFLAFSPYTPGSNKLLTGRNRPDRQEWEKVESGVAALSSANISFLPLPRPRSWFGPSACCLCLSSDLPDQR